MYVCVCVCLAGSALLAALRALRTVQAAGISLSLASASLTAPICQAHHAANLSILMHASMGNLPRLGLFSSVVRSTAARYGSSTANASSAVLSLSTSDGRDDHVKLCNGIGRCDFSSGRSGRSPPPQTGHSHHPALLSPLLSSLLSSLLSVAASVPSAGGWTLTWARAASCW